MKYHRMSLLVACALGLAAAPTWAGDKSKDDKFKQMDADGDGRVSQSEHATGARQMFTKMDADGNGTVTAAEMDGMQGDKHHRSASNNEADPRNDAQRTEHREKMAKCDQNGDGQLTAAEHEAGAASMFTEMDANGDGFVSKEEMAAGHKKHKRER